jgi:alcohol dehydrogenase
VRKEKEETTMSTAAIEPKTSTPSGDSVATMKALVYRTAGPGTGKPSWEDQPHPQIQHADDAIVRITTTTICGTDLHILKGDLPAVTNGRILGHEGIGIIEKVGAGVTSFKAGDKVIISCVTACLKCDFCRKGILSHCRNGGWILGNLINGTQAEFVRIPFADGSLYHFPKDAKEDRWSCSATRCRPALNAAC